MSSVFVKRWPGQKTSNATWKFPSRTRRLWQVGFNAFVLLIAVGSVAQSSGYWGRLSERLLGPAMLAGFVMTAVGCGQLVCRFGRLSVERKLESVCLSFSLGWVALSLIWLGIATIGYFRPTVLVTVSLLAYVGFGIGIPGGPSGWNEIASIPWLRLAKLYARRSYLALPAGLTGALIAWTFLWAAGPVWDWDSDMYHLPASQFLLEHHGLAVSDEQPLMNLPGNMYLWYAVGLAAGQPGFAALLMWVAAVATSLLAGCFASRHIGVHTALWTPLVYWSGAPSLRPWHPRHASSLSVR